MPQRIDAKLNLNAVQTNDTFYAKFKNAGSDDMTINGTTPVVFTLEDLPAQDFLLQRVTFLIGADAIVSLDQFGSIDALVNGVLFSANGDTPLITAEVPIQTNGDAILISSNVELETVSFAAVQATAIYGTWDFTETYNENAPIILNKDLKIIIQDDLSGMDYFKVSCHGILLD
jgi:nicotinic acid mononucleotide adenylyltransferase